MKREQTRAFQVGNLTLGGNNHVIIQSMTNTRTKNIEATVKQIQELEDAGCEMVRMAVFDKEDAYAIADIKKQVHIPLVADIHFDYRLALIAIESGIDKIRINPGNIGSIEKVKAVVESCKEHHIPIRIGVNGGSLEKDILEKYGRPTAEGMIESAKKHIDILESLDFHDYCISLKSSDTMLTIEAYTLASETFDCPLHLGVTEAGTKLGGTIKSSLGIGTLLYQGIGNTIRVSLSDHPVEEIKVAKTLLKDKGYELEVKVFDDYVQPNNVVESGEFDANYFQHVPYLEQFNEEKGTHLVVAGKIHYEPFGIYPGTKKDLKDIAKGDKIAVPNDTTNEARALLLLQDNGIIKLKDGAGIKATVNDIEENPNNIEIVELEAAQVPRVVNEVAYVVLNGNYALEANYTVKKDALAYEKSDSEAAKTYVNVIAVKEGNENSEKIKALVDVLKSDSIKKFINEKYDGAVIVYDGE